MLLVSYSSTSTTLNSFISLKFRPENPFYGRAAAEVIFRGHFYEAAQRFFTSTFITFITHGLTTTDDFEVDDDTTTTDQLYQEYYANLYALGFRLVVS